MCVVPRATPPVKIWTRCPVHPLTSSTLLYMLVTLSLIFVVVVQGSHTINGKRIDVKKAIGKNEMGGGRGGGGDREMGGRGGGRSGDRGGWNDGPRGGGPRGGGGGWSSGGGGGSGSQPWGGSG